MKHPHAPATNAKRSPLYTPPALKAAKAITIREFGKDADGAFRVSGRIDVKKGA